MLDEKPGTKSSTSSQRCSMGLKSGLCVGQSGSYTPNTSNHDFMDLVLCTMAQVCWSRNAPFLNCFHKAGSIVLVKSLTSPFVGSTGLSQTCEKQLHTIISPLANFIAGTMQSGR